MWQFYNNNVIYESDISYRMFQIILHTEISHLIDQNQSYYYLLIGTVNIIYLSVISYLKPNN